MEEETSLQSPIDQRRDIEVGVSNINVVANALTLVEDVTRKLVANFEGLNSGVDLTEFASIQMNKLLEEKINASTQND